MKKGQSRPHRRSGGEGDELREEAGDPGARAAGMFLGWFLGAFEAPQSSRRSAGFSGVEGLGISGLGFWGAGSWA